MPQLHFAKQGQGPVIVFAHALGADLHMWDEVAAQLQSRYTILRYDQRGHGKSPALPGPYTMAALAEDAAALIAREVRQPVHFVGLSMGGMVAQQLAVRYPQMVRSIVVANSANHFEELRRVGWINRIKTIREEGIAAMVDGTMGRWFTPETHADTRSGGAARVARARATMLATGKDAYLACCEAIMQIDLRTSNGHIHCPALVVAGKRDESTPEAMSSAIALAISGAQLRVLDTAHMSAVEQPLSFAKLVADFIETDHTEQP